MSIALRALRAPAPRLTALVLTSILSLLSVAWLVPWAHAQSESSLPTEDARWQRMVAAGPYSVVNTGTGTMITTIPLVHLSGPGGTALDFTLYNTSTGVSVSSIGQIARGWRFTYDDWIYTAQQPNLSLYAQENSAGGGLQEWYRANNGVPFSRENGVRDDLTADPNGFYFTVQRKDQTTARYDQYRGNGYCLRSTTDTHGNTVSLSYDGLGRVSTIMDAGGRMLTLGWNPNDQFTLSSLTLNAGGNSRVWNFTTDANSCLTAITYPAPTTGGARPVLNLTPDGAGRITDLYDLNGNHWNYSYYTPAGGPTVIWNVTDPYSGLATNFNLLLSGPNRTMTIR